MESSSVNYFYWLGKRLEKEGCIPYGIRIYAQLPEQNSLILIYDGSLEETEKEFMERLS